MNVIGQFGHGGPEEFRYGRDRLAGVVGIRHLEQAEHERLHAYGSFGLVKRMLLLHPGVAHADRYRECDGAADGNGHAVAPDELADRIGDCVPADAHRLKTQVAIDLVPQRLDRRIPCSGP